MRDIAYRTGQPSRSGRRDGQIRVPQRRRPVHDAFIGDEAAQAEHEQEMRDGGSMHHGGDDKGVTVKPGKTASLTHTFKGGETLLIGCHQAGHYQAGMKVNVTVV